jgi:hypothetical protein
MNIQTRLFYDNDNTIARTVESEASLKWYTANTQQNRSLEYAHSSDVNVGTVLARGNTTRDTNKDLVNTELYGTAPYLKLRSGNNDQIDIESELFHRQIDGMNICDKRPLYSESYFGPSMPIAVEVERTGISTRNERIKYST